jgi:hypothetical protein
VCSLCALASFVYKFHIKTGLTAEHTNKIMVTGLWFPISALITPKHPQNIHTRKLTQTDKTITQISTAQYQLNNKQIHHVAYSIEYAYKPHDLS